MTQVVAPKLEDLKSRDCTVAELQATLIQLIEHHNKLCEDVAKKLDRPRSVQFLKAGQVD